VAVTKAVSLNEDMLTERLREAGLRLTLPRRAICRVLADSEEQFLSASMIVERVSETAGHLDASTVYRTLDELARIGLVHHLHLANGQPGTWHITLDHDHEHLVCESCGKTIEVPRTEFAQLYDVLRDKYGFETNPHHFAFLGHCDECEPQADRSHAHGTATGERA
jgi:Fur family ferric uptake transcriptional regulator